MRQYLSKQNDLYLFRRRVPDEIVHRIGKREIYRSLGTTSVRIARQRLLYLFHGTEKLFAMARYPEVTDDQLAAAARFYLDRTGGFLDKIRKMPPAILDGLPSPDIFKEEVDGLINDNQLSLGDTPEKRRAGRHALLLECIDVFLRRTGFTHFEDLSDDPQELGIHPQRIVQAVNREAERAVREQIKSLSHFQEVKQLPRAKAGTRFSEIIEPFVAWRQKTRPRGSVRSGRATLTKQTLSQIRTTYRLFSTIMKDPVLTMVDRKMVQQFREALELLPSSHGKTHGKVKSGPARTYTQELERKKESDLNPIKDKTIKRHFSALSQLFKFLQIEGYVPDNPFSGQQFNIDPGERRKWTKDELLTLFKSDEYSREKDSARHWIPLIALFSGMRLEELARLRPREDFFFTRPPKGSRKQTLVMQIAAHDGWKPKTPAAEREIPVHSWLIKHGFLEMLKRRIWELDDVDARRKSIYLFSELQPNGENGTITASFSREFSRLKTKLKIPAEVTFHSFRHLFRSQLGVLNIPDRIIDALLGHQDIERKVKNAYEKFDSSDLVNAVESFSLPLQNQRTNIIDDKLVPVTTTKKNYLDFLHRDDAVDVNNEMDLKATSPLRRLSNKKLRQRRTMAEDLD